MHFNLAGTPYGEAGSLINEYTKDIFEKAALCRFGNTEAVLPSKFHHGLILLLHTCHHMTGEGVGLRHLCDWAVFENSLSDSEFRSIIEEKLKEVGLWRFAQILTRVSIKYLGADEREWASCDEAVVDRLMEDILSGGNFGKKDISRAVQVNYISDRGKDGVKSSMFRHLVVTMNKGIYRKWKKAESYKILIPVGWVYFGCKHLLRDFLGNKKTDMVRSMKGIAERRALYQQFHLYERET